MENSLHDPSKDWLLATLNTIVNKNNITIGITIITHGFMVTGHLAGGKEYFESVGNEFGSILQSADLEDNFVGLAERIYNSDSDHIKNGAMARDYIHIKDVKFLNSSGNPVSAQNGIWWRGRLCEISGYSLGVVQG